MGRFEAPTSLRLSCSNASVRRWLAVRSLRYFTNENFEAVPMGVFSASAFWIVTVASAATHPEWPVALIAFAIYAWLLRSTRSLFAVIVAHAVTNAALGAYIMVTHDWIYW